MYSVLNLLTAVFCFITGYRFNKSHRHEETWQYRYLGSTMANIKANNWKFKLTGSYE